MFSLPLLKSLRDRFPEAQIHSLLRPSLTGLLEDSPYVDRIIPRRDALFSRLKLLWSLRRERYDLVISLPRSEEALLLTMMSNAQVKAGFYRWPWDRGLDVKEVLQGHYSWFNFSKLLARLDIPVSQDTYVGLLRVDEPLRVEGLPWR
ncbi:MAG TPA: hypothetical protein PLU54_09455, partial [Deltaproteobacteria bacterium]|nr:hypothetical protein [Deltaproteobacteria bacterium]